MFAHIPSLATLESNDDGLLAAELQLACVREYVAVVRALADQVDDLARPGDADGLSEQLIEEAARLGCRLLEAAAAMTRMPHVEQSGVFSTRSIGSGGSSQLGSSEYRLPASSRHGGSL